MDLFQSLRTSSNLLSTFIKFWPHTVTCYDGISWFFSAPEHIWACAGLWVSPLGGDLFKGAPPTTAAVSPSGWPTAPGHPDIRHQPKHCAALPTRCLNGTTLYTHTRVPQLGRDVLISHHYTTHHRCNTAIIDIAISKHYTIHTHRHTHRSPLLPLSKTTVRVRDYLQYYTHNIAYHRYLSSTDHTLCIVQTQRCYLSAFTTRHKHDPAVRDISICARHCTHNTPRRRLTTSVVTHTTVTLISTYWYDHWDYTLSLNTTNQF